MRAYDPRLTVMDGRCYLFCGGCITASHRRDGRFYPFEVLSRSLPVAQYGTVPEQVGDALAHKFGVYRSGRDRFDI
jgi:hypothetical protein